MATYNIGQAAKLVGVTPMTLKRWEASGRYEAVRSKAGYRIYDDEGIAMLKALAGGLSDIARLDDVDDVDGPPRPNPQVEKLPPKPKQEFYDIGFGEYARIMPAEAPEYIERSKRRAFHVGYPEPSEKQVAFREKMLKRR